MNQRTLPILLLSGVASLGLGCAQEAPPETEPTEAAEASSSAAGEAAEESEALEDRILVTEDAAAESVELPTVASPSGADPASAGTPQPPTIPQTAPSAPRTDLPTVRELPSVSSTEVSATSTSASRSPASLPAESPESDDALAEPTVATGELHFITVYYGTDRTRSPTCVGIDETTWDATHGCRPNDYYGGQAAESSGGSLPLEVGHLTVTFPPDHEVGQVERPFSVFSITLRDEDPARDVVISAQASQGRDYDDWLQRLNQEVDESRKEAFIYVHGYSVPFADAARRAAQVAFDLDLDVELGGIPLMYSWPSKGTKEGYVADLDASIDATESFNFFLDLVSERSDVAKVHIIAHSMGNRLVANALRERQLAGRQVRGLEQLVLAAPDIPAKRFREKFLQVLPSLAQRVTLYVSDHDVALWVSQELRVEEPRAGQVAGGLLSIAADRFDAINASSLPSDFLSHSYYANNDSMLSDIYCLLQGFPPTGRPLIEQATAGWRFRDPQELSTVEAGLCRIPDPEIRRHWVRWSLLGLALLATWIAIRRARARRSATP